MAKSTRSSLPRKIPTTRALYKLFMERVINIEPVQRHREAAVGDHDPRPGMITHFAPGKRPRVYLPPRQPADFFSKGCHSGQFGEFMWPLHAAMQVFPWTWGDTMVSLPLLYAWNAAVVAFNEWIREIVDGKWIASGVNSAGVRYDFDPAAEFIRTNAILNVHDGDLFEECNGTLTLRWRAITLRAAEPAGTDKDGYQARRVRPALKHLHPKGVPGRGVIGTAALRKQVIEYLQPETRRLGLKDPSWQVVDHVRDDC